MATLRIEVRNAAQVRAALDRVDRRAEKEFVNATHKSVAEVHRFLAVYPPPPSGSDYIRTGRLGRSWTTSVNVAGDDIRGVVGTIVPYAPYVQDALAQARVHRGRWQTTADALKPPTIDKIIGYFEDAAKKIARAFKR